MDQEFDPHCDSPGNLPAEHPPNFYQLLGVTEFTSDNRAIADAADRQMKLLKHSDGDQQQAEVQRLLDEIARARDVLLDDIMRQEHDLNLRTMPQPAGYADILEQSLRTGETDSTPISNPGPSLQSSAPLVNKRKTDTQSTGRQKQKPTATPGRNSQSFRQKQSKLIKRPNSQRPRTLPGTITAIAKKAMGSESSFQKKKGRAVDWRISVFCVLVGGVFAAIITGVIYFWN